MSQNNETILQQFADYFCALRYEDLPEDVVLKAKMLTLDLLGVAIAGVKMDFPRATIDYLASLRGVGQATLLGRKDKVPAIHAALGNGVSGHALDMDDGYRFGGMHSGVAVIPAALAYAEMHNLDGKRLLLAIVAGYEICNRLARAMNPSHLNRGFHTTGTIGVMGAAAACGVLAGLDKARMTSAMGLAALQGAGLLEILNDGAMTKPIHPGKAAMAGVLSVELAMRGAQGPVTALEGTKGFFKAMADEIKLDELFADLGKHHCLIDQYIKLHAACRHIHPAIDGLLSVMKEHGLKFGDIDSVGVATYPVAVSFCGSTALPTTAEGAKFSTGYSVAMAAYYGDAGEDRYVQSVVAIKDIQALAARITSKVDDKWASAYPRQRGASLTIKTKQGNSFSIEVPLAKGEPEFPASDEDFIAKFRHNVEGQDLDTTEAMLRVLLALEKHKVTDLANLMANIRN